MKRHLSIVFEAFRHPQIQSRREKRKNNFYVSPLSYLRVFMLAYFYERRNTHKEIQKKNRSIFSKRPTYRKLSSENLVDHEGLELRFLMKYCENSISLNI